MIHIADAIRDSFTTEDKNLIEALDDLQGSLDKLGLNGAATSMGALEMLSKEVKEGSERIAYALSEIAEAIREHSNGN